MLSYHSHPSGPLRGELHFPGDKSISHRALLMAALAEGESCITNCLLGADNYALIEALRALGVKMSVDLRHATVRVQGVGLQGLRAPSHPLDLQNSGTAMRLLMGVLAAQPFTTQLIGDQSLSRRPMLRVAEPLRAMGATVQLADGQTAPVTIVGQSLQAIEYTLPMPSAQVKSALLFAGLYATGRTIVIEPLVTRDHTERLLALFGVTVESEGLQRSVQGQQRLTAVNLTVPGDLSSAAFFLVAASITPGSHLWLRGVGINPTRDGVLRILRAMGADIREHASYSLGTEPVADLEVRSAPLQGVSVAADAVALAIDEIPCLAVAAACASGETVFEGIGELRVKESDRAAAVGRLLTTLGISCCTDQDRIMIRGGHLRGARLHCDQDHRIAMALAVAGAVAKQPVTIEDCAAIATSFPQFRACSQSIGMKLEVG